MSYIISLDAGTSSVRAFVYDLSGQVIAVAASELKQHCPKLGWVEFDGDMLWKKTLSVLRKAILKAGIEAKDILSIGITNQRETVLMWDKHNGNLLGSALSWQDRRTEIACQQLSECEQLIVQKTGLVVSPYFSATKISWMLTHYDGAKELLRKQHLLVGTVDSFLVWRLSGGKRHVTDITNASRTMLMNIDTGEWDDALLALFQISPSILPTILASDDSFATVNSSFFGCEIPITGVLGDQQAALFGQGCYKPGMAKITYGTGGFLLMNTGMTRPKPVTGLLTTVAYKTGSECYYALEGSMYAAGSILKWLKEKLKLLSDYDEVDRIANSIKDNGGVYLIPAFTGLASPYWQHHIKAAFLGIGLDTDKRHFIRAALEAIVYQTLELLDVMENQGLVKPISIAVDGGVSKSDWLLEYLSNCSGLTVCRNRQLEMTCFGAFKVAAKGSGVYNLADFGKDDQKADKICTPNPNHVYQHYYQGWKHALKTVLEDVN